MITGDLYNFSIIETLSKQKNHYRYVRTEQNTVNRVDLMNITQKSARQVKNTHSPHPYETFMKIYYVLSKHNRHPVF